MKYCKAAMKAMDAIWNMRNLNTNLLSDYLMASSKSWSSSTATIGAGVDSYYEYLMKGYIMIGDEELFKRFVIHYEAIEKYLKNDVFSYDKVSMSNPKSYRNKKTESLEAFWPSIQVLILFFNF